MRTRNVLILILITALLSTSLTYVLAQTPTSPLWITPGLYPGSTSYTVWAEGSNTFAKDENGQLDYAETSNASGLLQSVFNSNPSSVRIKSNLTLLAQVNLIYGDTEIEGDSVRQTTIQWDFAGIAFSIGNTSTRIRQVTIKNLAFKGKGDATSQTALYFNNTAGGEVLNCYFSDLTGVNSWAVDSERTAHYDFEHNTIYGCYNGIRIQNGTSNTINSFSDNYLSGSSVAGGIGLYIGVGSTMCKIYGNTFEYFLYRLVIESNYHEVFGNSFEVSASSLIDLLCKNGGRGLFVGNTFWENVTILSFKNVFVGNDLKIEFLYIPANRYTRFYHNSHGDDANGYFACGEYETGVNSGDWVLHRLCIEPTYVLLTPTSQVTLWVSAKNATHFQVGSSGAGINLYWFAEYVIVP